MTNKYIKIAFFGQKPIAEIIFSNLLAEIFTDAPLKIVFVCTNKKPSGWWASASLARVAESQNIPVIDNTSHDLKLIEEHLMMEEVDTLISIQHPHILETSLIQAVKGHAYNLHLAPLPRFRGWNGASHAIIEQVSEFGVTLHSMTSRIDFGLVIDRRNFALTNDATAWSVYQDSVDAGTQLMAQFFKRIAHHGVSSISGTPMDGESCYYSRTSLDALKDVGGRSFPELQRIWRATYFPPHPPAFFRTPHGQVQLIYQEGFNTE